MYVRAGVCVFVFVSLCARSYRQQIDEDYTLGYYGK